MRSDFVHLELQSAFSFHYGPRSVDDLVNRARDLGYGALAITDRDSLSGVHAFEAACGRCGIKPVYGIELSDPRMGYRASLLAKDREGFAALCRLCSMRALEPDFALAPAVAEYGRGLIVLSDNARLLEAWHRQIEELYAVIRPGSAVAHVCADRLGIPLLASMGACLLEPEDRETQRLLIAIGSNRPLAAVDDGELCHPRSLLASPAIVAAEFTPWPQAVMNSLTIACQCQLEKLFGGWIFPGWPGGADPALVLRNRAMAGAELRYGELGEAVLQRLDYELEIIVNKGFAAYFLTVADIVANASRTCGRGSGAASVVAYSLGITNVDPLAHNLYFERFLNPERTDPPDIDVDFAWDERDGVLDWVIGHFGLERVARVANHVHFQPAHAVRQCARALGLDDGWTNAWLQGNIEADGGASGARIRSLAASITGLPCGLSIHSGGVVICPDAVSFHAPVSLLNGSRILGWEKEGTEAAGLVKIDLLGNRSLAVVRDALAGLVQDGAPVPDPHTWRPWLDPATCRLLAEGRSMGVFYIESPAMRQLQQKTGRGDFEHVVIHSSIIRPAANRFINAYIQRLKGLPWKPVHPLMEEILAETCGIMCYQEDIAKVAMALAGFGPGDADRLRKIVSKKSGAVLEEYHERFVTGCRERQCSEESIEAIWSMILSFAGYSFCKPHSASYAMVSFQSAWLKTHHPAWFMAAVLNNEGGYYQRAAYVSEARRLGIQVLGPDAGTSDHAWRASGHGTIRAGLRCIAGLSSSCIQRLVEERMAAGSFASPENLVHRTGPARDEILALVEAGALDSLAPGLERSRILARCLAAGERRSRDRELFATSASPPDHRNSSPRPGTRRVEAELELARIGFWTGGHPLELYRSRLDSRGCIKAERLTDYQNTPVELLLWLVSRKGVLTSGGEAMEFISFEDETALVEAVCFPDVYRRISASLSRHAVFRIRGVVRNDQGAWHLELQDLRPMGIPAPLTAQKP